MLEITLKEGKCVKCRRKGFVGDSGLCLHCASKLAVQQIKRDRKNNKGIKSDAN